jgi:hypothetical protein
MNICGKRNVLKRTEREKRGGNKWHSVGKQNERE